MADGNEYGVVLLKEAGQPVEPVYPTEGTPTISGPTGIFASAPHPNAARLFQAWLHTRETQQFFIDFTAQYSVHRAGAVETGPPQDFRHQADEGGRRRRRGNDRRDQDALCAAVSGVIWSTCARRPLHLAAHSGERSEATQSARVRQFRTVRFADAGAHATPRPGMTEREAAQVDKHDPHHHHRRPQSQTSTGRGRCCGCSRRAWSC